MIEPDNILTGENFRQIEDIIDARKLMGQYKVYKNSNGVNCRYVYSTGTSDNSSRYVKFEDMGISNDGNNLNNSNVKQTDSEITVVRVKCRKITLKNRQSKWDMQDIAVTGDGCHLSDNPSMVNLATLVGQNVLCEGEEYLVPLSSWDFYLKHEDDLKGYSESHFDNASSNIFVKAENPSSTEDDKQAAGSKNDGIDLFFRRPTWAGKISKFIRKHCKKSRSLFDPCQHKN